MKRFEGKVAFVTGAGRGIGKEIASAFAEEGARICLADINLEALENTASEFRANGYEVYTAVMDVSNREEVDSGVAGAVEAFGKIDILINNAGVTRDNFIFKMTDEDWDTVLDIHLKGAFYCSRAVQKYMVQNHFGRIINISSTGALGNRAQVNYSAAKAGLQGFTKTLAIELGKFGITTNCIAPGFIETEMTRMASERRGVDFEEHMKVKAATIPVNRTGKPADIANAALFFAMEQTSYVNGQVLYVAGGPKT